MSKFLLFMVFLLAMQTAFAQARFDEYSLTNSDLERGRIIQFLTQLTDEPESKGLIIIYAGENKAYLTDALRHREGIKTFINLRSEKSLSERVYFKIENGGKLLDRELWIYPKNVALPETQAINLNLDNLKTKYLYTTTCVGCEPVVSLLSPNYEGFEMYADLLKKYPNYKSLIVIYPSALDISERNIARKQAQLYAADCKSLLTKQYKIDKSRISIKIVKTVGKDDVTKAKIFILPKIDK